MNDLINGLAEDSIPFQSSVQRLSPNQLTMMSLASKSNYQPLEMARLCHISLRQLERVLKVESGCTPRQWLRTQRLNNALLMLRTANSVKQVAYSLAYAQIPQFCREFKARFGLTPREFRESQTRTQERIVAAWLCMDQEIGPRHPLRRIIESQQVVPHNAA